MSAARGESDQKDLAAYMRGFHLSDNSDYPDDRTISRWMNARGVPADALVVAQMKIVAEGGSIDELLGAGSPLEDQVRRLDDRVKVLERLMAQQVASPRAQTSGTPDVPA